MENENAEWIHAPNTSPLSRKEYTNASLYDNAEKIISVIADEYNTGNRGVDLELECSADEYLFMCSVLSKKYADTISCKQKKSKIVIAGKVGSGKTTLIEELGKHNGIKFIIKEKNYTVYEDDSNRVWYELNGIDLGKEYVKQTQDGINWLADAGMTVFIYCLSTSKIEELEAKLILGIQSKYPNVKILVVLTSCIDEDYTENAEKMSNSINSIKVLPVLAKDKKTKQGVISTYGLDDVSKFIYGGK